MTSIGSDQKLIATTINEDTYKHYIDASPAKTELLTFQDWAAREQVKLLRTIKNGIVFFVTITLLGIVLGFFQILL